MQQHKTTNRSLGAITSHRMFSLNEVGFKSPEPKVDQAIRQFLKIGNHDVPDAVATRWIEMPKGVLLFQTIPGNDASGAIYLYDRSQQTFYLLVFEERDSGLTASEFESLLSEYDLLRFATQPSLLHVDCQTA